MMAETAPRVLGWSPVPQRTVGPDLVVVDTPHADLRARLLEIGEPVLVQAFIAEPAIEARHEGVLDLRHIRWAAVRLIHLK
jgi:hypothetical protein